MTTAVVPASAITPAAPETTFVVTPTLPTSSQGTASKEFLKACDETVASMPSDQVVYVRAGCPMKNSEVGMSWLKFESPQEVLNFAYWAMELDGLVSEGWKCLLVDNLAHYAYCNSRNKTIRISREYAFEFPIALVQRGVFHEIAHAVTNRETLACRKALSLMCEDLTASQAASMMGVNRERFRVFLRSERVASHGIEWARNAVARGVLPEDYDGYVYYRVLTKAQGEFQRSDSTITVVDSGIKSGNRIVCTS